MSKNEQMYGELKLPSGSFNSFIKELKKRLNSEMEKELSIALKVYETLIQPENKALLKAHLKGTKGNFRGYALRDFVEKQVHKAPELQNRSRDRFTLSPSQEVDYERAEKVTRLLCSRQEDGSLKIKKPSKKQLPLLGKESKNYIINGEGYLSWDTEKKTLKIDIKEGNRSVENVMITSEYQAFHDLLLKVDWKKNTGGVFYYDDEYSRDADREYSQSHQMAISGVFGPEGKAIHDFERGVPALKPIRKRPLSR